MKKVLSITVASVLAAGLLVGCGSSSKKSGKPTPTPVDPKQCVYTPSSVDVIKDSNFTVETLGLSIKDGAGKALESNATMYAGVNEVNTSTLGEYNVTASHPSCDNNATIKVMVKEKQAPTPGDGSSVGSDGIVRPF